MKVAKTDWDSFYKHLSEYDVRWIKDVYYGKPYRSISLVALTGAEIKKLYVYHDAPGESHTLPFRGIYKPLGITKAQYEKRYFTVEDVVKRLKKINAKPFADRRLKWYGRMYAHHQKHLDLIKNPVTLRKLKGRHYELIDGNRRIIAKSLKEGFTFSCRAYILS